MRISWPEWWISLPSRPFSGRPPPPAQSGSENPQSEAITAGQVKKGDVLTTARLAAILAVKDTPRLIPLCHPIPITGLDVNFDLEGERVRATVTVTSVGKTGVEMEALTGVAVALLNVWDMVKYLEKDETGNYPETEIEEIRVLQKRKGA